MTLSTCRTQSPEDLDAAHEVIASRYAEFCSAWRRWKQKNSEIRQLRIRAAGEVGLPSDGGPSLYSALTGRFRDGLGDFLNKEAREAELLEARGLASLLAQANSARERAGQLANEIFAMPALSLQDVAVKVRIMRHALGRRGAQEDGDEDLDAFQDDADEPWFDTILHDMERLAGRDDGA